MPDFSRILVLDFDGTVCLGDGPVLAYARLLDVALRPAGAGTAGAGPAGAGPAGARRVGVVEATLAWFLGDATAPPSAAIQGIIEGSADGYEGAERIARSLGATDGQLSAAYAESRAELAAGGIPTWTPPGLPEFLAALPSAVQRVLVTNSPADGVTQQLRHLKLANRLDRVVTDAGKPAGMGAILTELRGAQGLDADPGRLLSVGDIWRNDLEPAFAEGSVTALIERLPAPVGAAPTFRAPLFEQLYPAIAAWAID